VVSKRNQWKSADGHQLGYAADAQANTHEVRSCIISAGSRAIGKTSFPSPSGKTGTETALAPFILMSVRMKVLPRARGARWNLLHPEVEQVSSALHAESNLREDQSPAISIGESLSQMSRTATFLPNNPNL